MYKYVKANELYLLFKNSSGISTDSRKLTENCIFVAIKGDSFNGNAFAKQALENGAAYAIIDDKKFYIDDRTVLVDDCLKSLRKIAIIHRSQFHIPFIGITGTNGKTTTKELIHSVLSKKYRTFATPGNFNNHIGVPLSILSIPHNTEIAVIEMGANHIGEIAELCKIAQPSYGIITNIGKAHLEGFGSEEGVIVAKNELYENIRKAKGKVFVNNNDELLMQLSADMQRVLYGNSEAFCIGKLNESSLCLHFDFSTLTDKQFVHVETQLVGNYNFNNCMAAAAFGAYFGIDNQLIAEALSSYSPQNNRSQLVKTTHNTIVLDAYNANPGSMNNAIKSFLNNQLPNKVLILGDMLELGEYSNKEHEEILKQLTLSNANAVYLVGSVFNSFSGKYPYLSFPDTNSLYRFFEENPIIGKSILIKGSRGIGLEKLIPCL